MNKINLNTWLFQNQNELLEALRLIFCLPDVTDIREWRTGQDSNSHEWVVEEIHSLWNFNVTSNY